jgi:hypothetical protein
MPSLYTFFVLNNRTNKATGKKLKRRLEDLERRAGSSSESPPQIHAQLKQASRKNDNAYKTLPNTNGSNQRQKLSPRVIPHNQYTPPMQNDDDMLFSSTFDRDGSHTPPLFAYHHSYPAPEESIYPPYPPTQTYRPTTTAEAYSEYLAPAPMTLPSMMHFTDSIKREHMGTMGPGVSGPDDSLNPFSMSYAAMAGIDMHGGSNVYEDSNPHVRPSASAPTISELRHTLQPGIYR